MSSRLKQIPESLIARLWMERASREKSLRAGDGRRFKVLYPGRVGTTAGPDFRGAVLEEEGVGLVRGDVEVHVSQGDWEAHGHGKDPRYNGVVLHVVVGMDSPSTTLHNGNRVPVMSLKPLLSGRAPSRESPDLWPLLAACGYPPPTTAVKMGALLDGAGDRRFLGNSEAFRRLIQEEDPEQIPYSSLMEALGYSQNKAPFLELARQVPYHLLERKTMSSPPACRCGLIVAVLLTAAGFLPDGPAGDDLEAYGRTGRRSKSMSLGQWHLFRVRPQNHPRRRIMGFATLLNNTLPSPDHGGTAWSRVGLLEGMTRLLRASGESGRVGDRWRTLEDALTGSVDQEREGGSSIGKGRARDMAVNCVLPFLHGLGLLRGDTQLAELSFETYRGFPLLQENELTREMRLYLLQPGGADGSGTPETEEVNAWKGVAYNARRQQGLLHLHHLASSPGRAYKGAPTPS